MSTPYRLPLTNAPQQLLIALGGTTYTLTVKWNDIGQVWVVDIGDVNNLPIVTGIPLVTGADLLAPYEYLEFGGELIAETDFDPTVSPTFDNLGSTGNLYFVVA